MRPGLVPTSPSPPPETNPFRYGWRYVKKVRPDGSEELDQVPLTLEDVLHPQEEDVIPEKPYHKGDRRYLSDTFRTRLPRLPGGLVLSDCLVDWGNPAVRNHSPDISVFEGVEHQPSPYKGTFRLAPSGGHCVLAIELVSADTRTNDVDRKLEEYHEAGVPLYVIVDQKREEGPREVLAYRDTPDGFVQLSLDERSRVLLEPLGLWLGLKDNFVVCYDAETDEELGDYTAVHLEREAAKQQAREEAQARVAAEARERQEAQARVAAEVRERQEAQAREAAEQQARAEAQARAAAEQRLREVEAELRRLRGEGP